MPDKITSRTVLTCFKCGHLPTPRTVADFEHILTYYKPLASAAGFADDQVLLTLLNQCKQFCQGRIRSLQNKICPDCGQPKNPRNVRCISCHQRVNLVKMEEQSQARFAINECIRWLKARKQDEQKTLHFVTKRIVALNKLIDELTPKAYQFAPKKDRSKG